MHGWEMLLAGWLWENGPECTPTKSRPVRKGSHRKFQSLSFLFLSIHVRTATPSLEDYEQVYIVHTCFAG